MIPTHACFTFYILQEISQKQVNHKCKHESVLLIEKRTTMSLSSLSRRTGLASLIVVIIMSIYSIVNTSFFFLDQETMPSATTTDWQDNNDEAVSATTGVGGGAGPSNNHRKNESLVAGIENESESESESTIKIVGNSSCYDKNATAKDWEDTATTMTCANEQKVQLQTRRKKSDLLPGVLLDVRGLQQQQQQQQLKLVLQEKESQPLLVNSSAMQE